MEEGSLYSPREGFGEGQEDAHQDQEGQEGSLARHQPGEREGGAFRSEEQKRADHRRTQAWMSNLPDAMWSSDIPFVCAMAMVGTEVCAISRPCSLQAGRRIPCVCPGRSRGRESYYFALITDVLLRSLGTFQAW